MRCSIGPSTIKEILDSGNKIFMIERVVNSQGYGNASPKIRADKKYYQNGYLIKNSSESLLDQISLGIHFKIKK